jgi:type IV pilus assembly protein PilX
MRSRNGKSADRQQGAALIVGLVLLMALTVLAISTMRSSTMELTMAANAKYRESAFQFAEAGISGAVAAINSGASLPDAVIVDCNAVAWGANVSISPVDPLHPNQPVQGTYQTRVCYRGDALPHGFSNEKFKEYHFTVESRSATDQRGAQAQHTLGFYVIGPRE